jgi:hypothetical protein
MIVTYEYKLSTTLDIPYIATFTNSTSIPQETNTKLLQAIGHQNIIGWDHFLKGFTSIYWLEIYNASHSGTCDKLRNRVIDKVTKSKNVPPNCTDFFLRFNMLLYRIDYAEIQPHYNVGFLALTIR